MMPRGIPNQPRATPPAAAPIAAAPAEPTKAIRSREEQSAEEYAAEFLKHNRVDLTGFEKKLAFQGVKAGWVRYWALDQGSRLPNLLARGWRFVARNEVVTSESVGRGNTDVGDQVSVVTTAGDGPVRQVLMEIPQQLYDMYTQAKTEPARAAQDAIKQGAFDVKDKANVYIPGEQRNSALFGTHNRIESKPA